MTNPYEPIYIIISIFSLFFIIKEYYLKANKLKLLKEISVTYLAIALFVVMLLLASFFLLVLIVESNANINNLSVFFLQAITVITFILSLFLLSKKITKKVKIIGFVILLAYLALCVYLLSYIKQTDFQNYVLLSILFFASLLVVFDKHSRKISNRIQNALSINMVFSVSFALSTTLGLYTFSISAARIVYNFSRLAETANELPLNTYFSFLGFIVSISIIEYNYRVLRNFTRNLNKYKLYLIDENKIRWVIIRFWDDYLIVSKMPKIKVETYILDNENRYKTKKYIFNKSFLEGKRVQSLDLNNDVFLRLLSFDSYNKKI